MIYGLKIKVDFSTGKRAGKINPKDPNLKGNPSWQNLEDGWEIRVITDDRDIEIYRNLEGVTLLEGETAIDQAIQDIASPIKYTIKNEQLMIESVKQKGIDMSDITNDMTDSEVAETLFNSGALGIKQSSLPKTVSEVIS